MRRTYTFERAHEVKQKSPARVHIVLRRDQAHVRDEQQQRYGMAIQRLLAPDLDHGGGRGGPRRARLVGGRMTPMTRVLLVRHGETNENVQGIVQGQLDTLLNAMGVQQAQRTGVALQAEPVARIISSPLQRTVHVREPTDTDGAGDCRAP